MWARAKGWTGNAVLAMDFHAYMFHRDDFASGQGSSP